MRLRTANSSGSHPLVATIPTFTAHLKRLSASVMAFAFLSPLVISGCQHGSRAHHAGAEPSSPPGFQFETPLRELNDGRCENEGELYTQEELQEPVKIAPVDGATSIDFQMVVALRDRCVPVWNGENWVKQTLKLRTYGFPTDPNQDLTPEDADHLDDQTIYWSAPGPTVVVHPASKAGLNDGTQYNMRLYNRMPNGTDPHQCNVIKKCNTTGPNAGLNSQGQCIATDPNQGGVEPSVPSQKVLGRTVEPPNCFHGDNSTNFHFHGFHVSPQRKQDIHTGEVTYQDNVFLELRPPQESGGTQTSAHHSSHHGSHQSSHQSTDQSSHQSANNSMHDHKSTHGEQGVVEYGHADYQLDPLRYTQPPGTHWYHAHKHGSTALQVLNGLVGTFEVRGEFDEQLKPYYDRDRLLVVQQLQEQVPGMGGADQTGSVLVNGQAHPIVKMRPGEIQRWRFVGATMQASALLRIGFHDTADGSDKPQVRQIAMDGVQFSPDNYQCQPILNNPDCSHEEDNSEFDELSDFNLAPGNRIDVLVKAPSTPGKHCMVLDVRVKLEDRLDNAIRTRQAAQMARIAQDCNYTKQAGDPAFGPLLIVEVTDEANMNMAFPTVAQFPQTPSYLADISSVEKQQDLFYQMHKQTQLKDVQFWISQTKFNPQCFNETLVLDKAEEWTIYNNSLKVSHPFHIHQNPFQLLEESRVYEVKDANGNLIDRTRKQWQYRYPLWRDTLALPLSFDATDPTTNALAFKPNSEPTSAEQPWGVAKIRYVAKEFTGPFVNHCHILGHEDRGMMHATQAVCENNDWALTGPVSNPQLCDNEGFCESDCQRNNGSPIYLRAAEQCPAPPPQTGEWPALYGIEL